VPVIPHDVLRGVSVRAPLWIGLVLVTSSVVACAQSREDRWREIMFDQVWEHIDNNFYDETFGGRDWSALGRDYRDKAINADTDKDFYVTLNEMLFRLDVSHIGVIPQEHPEWIGAPATFANGEVGLDIRIVDDQIVVVRRKTGLKGASGIQPGTVITKLNGLTLQDIMAEVTKPPLPAIPLQMLATERAGRELYRDVGEVVEIAYLDEGSSAAAARLTAYARDGAVEMLEGIPPVYLDFETRVLDDGVGYIRFNSFHPDLTDGILAAIAEFHDLPGLVIDVRGNSGGDFQVRRAIAENLLATRARVWQYVNRFGTDDIVLEPSAGAYRGGVVFLVDEMSASSAEELSGAMQALGRAKVVGNRTAGLVLVAGVHPLGGRATLVYPSAETRFVNGFAPEGKGVTPDISVPYDVPSLRAGRDGQLDAAVEIIREESFAH
jgi:C-terminal processing protease CtpA/Prc